eukprot:scaffold22451_cov45-Attheya_sp.AAC.2
MRDQLLPSTYNGGVLCDIDGMKQVCNNDKEYFEVQGKGVATSGAVMNANSMVRGRPPAP